MYPKVIGPSIAPGMEESGNLIRERVDAREVRALSQIAAMTSKSEVGKFFGPAMLFGNNVFNVVSERTVFLP